MLQMISKSDTEQCTSKNADLEGGGLWDSHWLERGTVEDGLWDPTLVGEGNKTRFEGKLVRESPKRTISASSSGLGQTRFKNLEENLIDRVSFGSLLTMVVVLEA